MVSPSLWHHLEKCSGLQEAGHECMRIIHQLSFVHIDQGSRPPQSRTEFRVRRHLSSRRQGDAILAIRFTSTQVRRTTRLRLDRLADESALRSRVTSWPPPRLRCCWQRRLTLPSIIFRQSMWTLPLLSAPTIRHAALTRVKHRTIRSVWQDARRRTRCGATNTRSRPFHRLQDISPSTPTASTAWRSCPINGTSIHGLDGNLSGASGETRILAARQNLVAKVTLTVFSPLSCATGSTKREARWELRGWMHASPPGWRPD